MKALTPDEAELVGRWISKGTEVYEDRTCERIDWLTEKVLQKIGYHKKYGNWETLYRDPQDGRLWVKIHFSEIKKHGVDPPALKCISEAEAKEDFPPVKTLTPDETALVGEWIVEGTKVYGDEACNRINWLTENDFQEIGYHKEHGAWETLYRDPQDGRFWVKTYPQ